MLLDNEWKGMKNMRKMVAWMVFFALVLSSCKIREGVDKPQNQSDSQEGKRDQNLEPIELTLWTYPVGNWTNPTNIASVMGQFHRKNPDIHISVEFLDYNNDTGDHRVQEAIASGNPPDLIFEGPERLVANWGEQGVMADLSDLWQSDTAKEIYDSVRVACCHQNGQYYIVPICMGTHCMAINYDMFQAAGALQYIDEKTRTWSTQDFIHAVEALRAYGQEEVGVIYCKGQGGDQGTRALVNNLYSGTFTNDSHTRYTADSEENIRALQLLYDLEGIRFAPELVGSDEIAQFCSSKLAMAFCWNVSLEINQIVTNPNLDFEIFPMAFPTDSGQPKLQGGIWGFGIFDHGDPKKVQAAKTFISFLTENNSQYAKAVQISGYWPVRPMEHIYANDELMNEYSIFTQYMGDYYQITHGWAKARTAWWMCLQKIGEGEEIAASVDEFVSVANAAARQAEEE